MSAEVVLALGSNLGDRAGNIRSAITAISAIADFEVLAVSKLYESLALTPQGPSSTEPAYLNAVLLGRYSQPPLQLLAATQEIEQTHGRRRTERWAARTLDIDIIKYGDLEVNDEFLKLPHPEAVKRAFVLVPWLEIQPNAAIVGSQSLADKAQSLSAEVRIYEGG